MREKMDENLIANCCGLSLKPSFLVDSHYTCKIWYSCLFQMMVESGHIYMVFDVILCVNSKCSLQMKIQVFILHEVTLLF